jgi:hypothetical protein
MLQGFFDRFGALLASAQLFDPIAGANVPPRALTGVSGATGLPFHQGTASASGSTVLWTPQAGKRFRLMRYMITVPSNCAAAAQADLVIALLDGAGAFGQIHVVSIPSAAVLTAAPPLYVSPWVDLGNGVISAAANNVLNINLSFALTAGQVNVIVAGTEE